MYHFFFCLDFLFLKLEATSHLLRSVKKNHTNEAKKTYLDPFWNFIIFGFIDWQAIDLGGSSLHFVQAVEKMSGPDGFGSSNSHHIVT